MKVVVGLFLLLFLQLGFAQSARLQKAEAYLGIKEYKHALEYFSICPPRDSVKLNKIAYCQMMMGDSKEAERSYTKFLESYKSVDSNVYHFALTLKRNRKYAEAKLYFQKLQQQAPADKHFLEQLASCDSAVVWEKRESKYVIENAGKINSEYSDVTSVPFNDGLVFASNRESVIIRKKSDINEEPYFNLLFSKFDTNNFRLTYPVNFSSIINTPEHEIAPTFSNDKRQIFYTNCKENLNLGTNYSRKLKLYAAEQSESSWQTPHTFIFNDSSCSYGHPCMSPDGKMFFFSSDMKGGVGGVDLYVCLNIENKWTNPINLGATINTPGDELYPFYHLASGKLYFSSNYHTGMGGFDLFEASEQEGEWGMVRNLGIPFNSADDDFALYLSPGMHYGFLSSNRPGGLGKEDVFLLKRK